MKGGKKMDEDVKDRKALKLFLVLALGTSAILEAVYITLYFVTGNKFSVIMLGLMWTPGIAGIIASFVYYRKKNALGIRLGKIRYILLGILIPLVYLVASYGIAWFTLGDPTIGIDGLAQTIGYQVHYGMSPMAFIVVFLTASIFSSCIIVLGEELGWRGFMYPVMERVTGRKKALLFSGLIWACWHMPIIVAGLYQSETVLWYGLLMFAVEATVLGAIMAWLRITSNSIVPALFIHASHNVFDQMVFQPMSTKEYIPYYAGEQGFLTILFIAAIAGVVMYFWKHSKNKVKETT